MARSCLSIGILVILIVASGAVAGANAARQDGIVSMQVDDLVIGENGHQLGPTRVAGFNESTEELVIEIDLSVLESHGVDVSDAEVDLTDADVDGGSLDRVAVADGRVRIVMTPEERGLLVETFRVTGLATEDAESATDVTYDVEFSAGEADADEFDIIDPTGVSPTVRPRSLWIDNDEQQVWIEDLQPADGDITIELDVSVLEDHGASLSALEAEVGTDGGRVHESSVQDGVVTVVVTPEQDQTLFDVVIELAGFGFDGVDTDDQTVASDVAYDVRIDGDAGDGATMETFDIISGPLTAQPTEPTDTPVDAVGSNPGFGLLVALVALVGGSLLAARRR